MNAKYKVPASTLRLNIGVLKELGLVEWQNGVPKITEPGKFLLQIIGDGALP